MYSIWGYYRHLFRRNLLSWRMLSVLLLTALTMDAFLTSLRSYCHDTGVRLSQWGFALLWTNKYVLLCFLLIYVYAVSNFPLDRERERYSIARMGASPWAVAQGLYLISFGWIYAAVLLALQNLFLCGVTKWSSGWGKGWSSLSGSSIASGYDIYVTVPYQVISNYEPLEANLLVLIILGLLLGMLGMLVMWLNFYSRAAGAVGGSVIVFLELAATQIKSLFPYSPANWVQLEYHYSLLEPGRPKPGYIVAMLLLLTLFELLMARHRVQRTQENNRAAKR